MSDSPTDKDPQTEEITYSHEYSDDYHIEPATGVYGGYQPQGNFKIDFTLDHNRKPKNVTYTVNKETGEDEESTLDYENEDVREHRVGVVMEGEHVFNSACWLISELIPDATNEEIQRIIADEYDLSGTENNSE
jgi:hypothetical protein